jgi:esterase/lipase superfamily enzyme
MILVSCRKDFSSDQKFSEELEVRDYPNPSNLSVFTTLSMDELVARAEGRHVLVLVHGYRNPLKNAADAYKQLVDTLAAKGLVAESTTAITSQYGLVVGFVWPGFKTKILGFLAARPNANRAGGYLRTLLASLKRGARTLDIQTHSLGARVALQALSTNDALWVDNLMLTAPAVDNECLQPAEEFNEALDSCSRAFVYHSKDDNVLKTYVAASLDRALGAHGPEDKKVTLEKCPNLFVIDCQKHVKQHSDYRKKPAYIEHWAKVMNQIQLPRYDALP